MKKVASMLLSAILAIGACFALVGCQNDKERIIDYIYKVTEIAIPEDSKLIYEHKEKYRDFFPVPGREEKYYVFEFENQPTDWLQANGFSEKKDPDYEYHFLYGGFGLMELSMSEEIPEEYLPDFEQPYFWTAIDGIYFAYFPDDIRLIIFVVPY